MSRKIKCPKCRETDFTIADDGKKPLSAGKALVGGVIAGPVGAVVGGALGSKGQATFVCNQCGHVWKEKL